MRSALRLATQARSAPTATETGPRGTSKSTSALPRLGGRRGALAGPAEDQPGAERCEGADAGRDDEPPAEPPPRPCERPGRLLRAAGRGAQWPGRHGAGGAQPADERRGRRGAFGGVDRHRLSDDVIQGGVDRRSGGGDLRPRGGAVGGEHRELVVAGERGPAREHVEGDAAERVDVRRAIDVDPADLLRRDVVGGPQDHPAAGHPGGPAAGGLGQGADPEVGQVGALLLHRSAEQHVLGLDVAVDQPVGMGGVEAGREVVEDPQRPFERRRAVGEQPPEVDAVDVLHGHVEASVLLAGVMDRDQVRMLHRRRQPALAAEPQRVGVVAGELRGEDLERPDPIEGEMAGAVDDPHAAAADLGLDQVTGELRARVEIRRHLSRPAAPGTSSHSPYAASRPRPPEVGPSYFGCGTIRM